MLAGVQLIGYSTSGLGQVTFTGHNPATGAALAPSFRQATEAEIDQAAQLAHQAFAEYRRWTGPQKAAFLEQIAEEILALEPLIATAQAETALPEARLVGERGRTVGQLRLFAQWVRQGHWVGARIDRALPQRQPLPRPDLRQMLVPLGPVAVFGASNFPLAFSVAGGDTASALAAGCPVLFKAHPAHPATCQLVGQAIVAAAQKLGPPEGVFSLLHGPAPAVGAALVQHPLVKAVGFTGSFAGGKALYDLAARRPEPIPVFAEMGSTNPVFLLPGALRERGEAIAKGLAASVTLGVGQFCTNPGVFVTANGPERSPFLAHLAQALAQTPGGIMLTEGIRQAYGQGLARLQTDGATPLAQGSQEPATRQVAAQLWQTSAQAVAQHPHLLEEVFGPVSVHVATESRDELLALARQLTGHLTATVHGTEADLAQYTDLLDVLATKAGRLIINGFPTGVEVSHAMVHGGPYPATTDSRSTSVGTAAIARFARPLCYQDFPNHLLPNELKDENPLKIWRLEEGEWINYKMT